MFLQENYNDVSRTCFRGTSCIFVSFIFFKGGSLIIFKITTALAFYMVYRIVSFDVSKKFKKCHHNLFKEHFVNILLFYLNVFFYLYFSTSISIKIFQTFHFLSTSQSLQIVVICCLRKILVAPPETFKECYFYIYRFQLLFSVFR